MATIGWSVPTGAKIRGPDAATRNGETGQGICRVLVTGIRLGASISTEDGN
jgi:hypothetical protein